MLSLGKNVASEITFKKNYTSSAHSRSLIMAVHVITCIYKLKVENISIWKLETVPVMSQVF